MSLIDISNSEYISIEDVMKNTIETGFKDYDTHVFDLKPGEITIVFGKDGEGKSTVASQIIAHHINRGKMAYLFSGELSNNKIQDWLYKQVAGNNREYYRKINTKYGTVFELKPNIINSIKAWHKYKLWVHDHNLENHDGHVIFDDIEIGAKTGIDLFVIDNVMTAFDADANTQYADQSNFIQKCKNYAIKYNVHIIIVAHPRKTDGEIEIGDTKGKLHKEDISGSKNISNKADNIIAIERIWKNNINPDCQGGPDMLMTSLKDRWRGQRKVFEYYFHKSSLRFYNDTTKSDIKFGWELKE